MIMLDIRPFAQGVDEPVWVEILNSANRHREEWRAITVEEFLIEEKHPSFDAAGMLIAELDGRPIGLVHAHVDKLRGDAKGFIRFGVIPEFRHGELERRLIETAQGELKARGMTAAQTGVESEEKDYIQLLEEMQFKPVRVFSMMEIDLAEVRHDIGENAQIEIRPIDKSMEEDIKLLNWLVNESFSEHFNFRPRTQEETRSNLLSHPYLKEQEIFFALLDGEGVGYVGVGIDEKYNLEKRMKAGDVFSIGVLKGHRGRGLATRLMLHGLEALQSKGMSKAMLGVDDDNTTDAMRVYERIGFKVKKKYLVFEREL
jgi:mycothiol synthase